MLRAKVLQIRKRKIHDVICNAFHLFSRQLEPRPNLHQQRTWEGVCENLSHQADCTESSVVIVGREANHSPNEFQESLVDRSSHLIDKLSKRGCRLCQLVRQESRMPIR